MRAAYIFASLLIAAPISGFAQEQQPVEQHIPPELAKTVIEAGGCVTTDPKTGIIVLASSGESMCHGAFEFTCTKGTWHEGGNMRCLGKQGISTVK